MVLLIYCRHRPLTFASDPTPPPPNGGSGVSVDSANRGGSGDALLIQSFCLVLIYLDCTCYYFISSADPKVSSAELMVLLICPSSVVVVRPSTFALNRYSSYSSYSIILNFLLEKLGI